MRSVEVLLLSLGVIARLVIVAGAGAFAAYRGLLPQDAIRQIAVLSAQILIPALIVASIGSSMSVALLRESAVVAAVGLVTILVSAAAIEAWGACLVPAAQRRGSLWRVAKLAAAFPNIVAVPLVTFGSLCERRDVNEDFGGDARDCASTAAALIFVNSFAWSLIFFTVGLSRLKALEAELGGAPAAAAAPRRPRWIAPDPMNSALAIGTAIGLIGPLRRGLFATPGSPLRVLGGAIELLASPVVCLAVMLTGASLAHVDLRALASEAARGDPVADAPADVVEDLELADVVAEETAEPATPEADGGARRIRSGVPEGGADSPDAVVVAEEEPEVVRTKAPAASVFAAVAALRWVIGGFLVVRLLVAPAIVFGVEAALRPAVPVPSRRLGRAVALVSSGMPSAQILVLLLHRFGMGRQAGELSFLFVFQYLAAVPTMTVLVTLALAVVY